MARISAGDGALGLLALCAVVLTGLTLRRELTATSRIAPAGAESSVRSEPNWRSYASIGHRTGPPSAPVTIVEFADYECGACRLLSTRLATLRKRFGDTITVVHRDYPLVAIHDNALPAAIAAGCAGRQGRFEEYRRALYQSQDSIGAWTWSDFAVRVAIPDTGRFVQCLEDSTVAAAVERDLSAGDRLGVRATPTMLINDMVVTGVPTLAQLDSMVRVQAARSSQD